MKHTRLFRAIVVLGCALTTSGMGCGHSEGLGEAAPPTFGSPWPTGQRADASTDDAGADGGLGSLDASTDDAGADGGLGSSDAGIDAGIDGGPLDAGQDGGGDAGDGGWHTTK